ncbi:MAG: isochorismate synthase [Caldilinea sp.]|nr:isochorismate synthase [Caldilinea sp.]MCB9120195.1 isochorismate synthase [Caldilineaceae bacterium]MCB9123834.1 isochorismate synthase [Caldilineaceae bacterium]MCW5844106.1 isochorismate synthase [Caldilinea sp.]
MGFAEQDMQMSIKRGDRVAALYHAAVASGSAVALWRRPHEQASRAIVDLSGTPRLAPVNLLEREPGFVFAPFVAEPAGAALQLRADLWFDGQALHVRNANGTRQRAERAELVMAALQNDTYMGSGQRWYVAPQIRSRAAGEAEFTTLVDDAIDFIGETGIAKVVVSRTAARTLPERFDPAIVFAALCERYPHAFVSLVAVPGVGTWLGATPEILLTLDNMALTTMALAGTQRRPNDLPLERVTWGRKETVEQDMVSAYVRGFFWDAGVTHVVESGPQTIAAGSVVHLQTLFRVELPEAERLALANRVLDELHPTSAVCGMPKHQALAFILAHEGYDRSFYSGFLGPVHIQGESSLYVNLRCMQLGENAAHLYVGAGITADSQPQAEWRETELKAETMLAVLEPASAPAAPQAPA